MIEAKAKRAIDALFTEFAQLDDMSVFRAVLASSLTPQQKRDALNDINLIKEKTAWSRVAVGAMEESRVRCTQRNRLHPPPCLTMR